MATEKWTAMTAANDVVPTQADGLADGSSADPGTEIDNATNKNRFAIAEFVGTFGSAPDAFASIDLYAAPAPDGTNYGNGNSTLAPSPTMYIGSFVVQANTNPQRLVTQRMEIPPCKFKLVVKNRSGASLPATVTINLYTFNRDIS